RAVFSGPIAPPSPSITTTRIRESVRRERRGRSVGFASGNMDAAYRSGTGEGNAPRSSPHPPRPPPPPRRTGESPMVRTNESQTAEPVVEVEAVRLSFGEKKVLRGVTFSVRRAETVALLGESGGGKSVCLK